MSDLATWTVTEPPARVEPSPRHVRVRLGDTLVADSYRALLLVWYGRGKLPTYCLPAADVRTDLLRPSSPPGAGPGLTFDHDVVVGNRRVERVARSLAVVPEGLGLEDVEGAERLAGTWTFAWDAGLTWLEEAQEVHVHARDPRHRVDAVPSDRRVRIERDGVLLAESDRPVALFETTLPTRWYLPMEDVRADVLVPSDTVSSCPYKGTARYWSVRVGDTIRRDLVWSYPDPIAECPAIAGLAAFFDERVDVTIDGVPQPRPKSPWS